MIKTMNNGLEFGVFLLSLIGDFMLVDIRRSIKHIGSNFPVAALNPPKDYLHQLARDQLV
jgi:hypothetical protein